MAIVPWLSSPVELHSSRDPGNCTLTPAQCAYKSRYWVFWYNADHVFALSTIYFFLAAIAVFTITRLITENTPRRFSQSWPWRRILSAGRFLSYKTFPRVSQPLGALLLASVGIIFFAAMTLGPRPYYWPKDAHYGNSPPLATRTGWMALACMPFVFALGAKANMITALTGVPPERLNVWHGWVSWAMFVLALIHTFPFIVFHRWVGDMGAEFMDGGTYVTGIVAIIAQAWLTFMSIPWIRNRHYEFFKSTHLFFAAVFVVFFFFHCGASLSSWDYFIATGVLYTLCFLYALGKTYLEHGFKHTARLHLETPQSLQIAIQTPATWTPGQHVFLRFRACGIHAFTAHPFTICSLVERHGKRGDMIFYVKPRGGITGRLAALAQNSTGASVPILLDGPYGGMPARWYQRFDRSLVVGGGSGCGFTLALLEDWLRSRSNETTAQMKIVVTSRDTGMRTWYSEALARTAKRESLLEQDPIPGLSIDIHETHDGQVPEPSNSEVKDQGLDKEQGMSSLSLPDSTSTSIASLFNVKFHTGRSLLRPIVESFTSQDGVTVGLAVCGPSGMKDDISSVATAAQARIIQGRAGAVEVWLHNEAFSY